VERLHDFVSSNTISTSTSSEEDLSFGVLFLAENKGSAPLNGEASLELLLSSFSSVHDSHFKLKRRFLGELRCSAQNGLGLASKSLLFRVVAAFALSFLRVLALLVLSYLPGDVLTCLSAVRAHGFRIMHLQSHNKLAHQ
jgi:hypothetical protein